MARWPWIDFHQSKPAKKKETYVLPGYESLSDKPIYATSLDSCLFTHWKGTILPTQVSDKSDEPPVGLQQASCSQVVTLAQHACINHKGDDQVGT